MHDSCLVNDFEFLLLDHGRRWVLALFHGVHEEVARIEGNATDLLRAQTMLTMLHSHKPVWYSKEHGSLKTALSRTNQPEKVCRQQDD